MRKVWKFELFPATTLTMPKGSKILKVHEQDGKICLWALVDTETRKAEDRSFIVVGTGHTLPNEELEYVGSTHHDGGTFVCHVFEVKQ